MAEEDGNGKAILHKLTPKKRAFLAAFTENGVIRYAAHAAGIARQTHYDWLKGDAEYVLAFRNACEDAADRLEREVVRRAVEGVVKPLVSGGRWIRDDDGQLVTIREYSDTLLIFALKGMRPEKYRERQQLQHEIIQRLESAPRKVGFDVDRLVRLPDDDQDGNGKP
jgi:hypothetical protein